MARSSVPRGEQLWFDFPEQVLGFDDIAITSSNETAVNILRKSASWPRAALCLVGAPRSGRTTLLKAWASSVDATIVDPKEFDKMQLSDIEALAKNNIAIDNADTIRDEELLLSLINFTAPSHPRLLLTATIPPALWASTSADLSSRLTAMPIAEIGSPDEAMLHARIKAAGRRRFLELPKEVTDYLIVRLGRSYESIDQYMDRLSAAMTRFGRAPTVPLARDVLEEGEASGNLFDAIETDKRR